MAPILILIPWSLLLIECNLLLYLWIYGSTCIYDNDSEQIDKIFKGELNDKGDLEFNVFG